MVPIVIDLVSSDDEAPVRTATKAAAILAQRPNAAASEKQSMGPAVPQKLPMAKRSGTSVHQERIRKADTFRRKEAESTAFHKARTSATPSNNNPPIAPAAPLAVPGTERPAKRQRIEKQNYTGEVIEVATGHAVEHVFVQDPTYSLTAAPFGRPENPLPQDESDSGPDEIPARPRAQRTSSRAETR
ncbi:hypothetical protein LTR95_018638, partial [Oleoguttula sp. CCFEE 5521]